MVLVAALCFAVTGMSVSTWRDKKLQLASTPRGCLKFLLFTPAVKRQPDCAGRERAAMASRARSSDLVILKHMIWFLTSMRAHIKALIIANLKSWDSEVTRRVTDLLGAVRQAI